MRIDTSPGTGVPGAPRIMSRIRIGLALAALAAGFVVAFVAARDGGQSTLEAVLGVGIGFSFVGSGLVAWSRRPDNRIGRVMVLAGFMRLGAEFCASPDLSLYPVGHLLHDGFWIGVAYVVLAFPSGRLEDALSRRLMTGATLVLPLQLAWLLVGGDGTPHFLTVTRDAGWARALDAATTGLILLLTPLVVAVLARRWWRASARLRVALAPVLWAGAVGFVLLLVMVVDDAAGNPLGVLSMTLLDLALAGVAVGFLVGLLHARLARSAVAELVVELGDPVAPGDLRDALARALRDPSLAVGYWLPDGDRYVDVEGRPFDLPAEAASKAVSVAEREGRRIAVLVHDPALCDEPELVQSVCAAAALALDNERLHAELRSRVQELRSSRARIVHAADAERRRIERNLHDGTQQRLVAVSMALGLAKARLESDPSAAGAAFGQAQQGLSSALEELRELSHGIHPGILTDRGLRPALEDLALRAAVPVELTVAGEERLPEEVAVAAYYVVCEALTNIAKHAHATSAGVRLHRVGGSLVIEVADDGIGGADAGRGSGLRGLADRIESLGGRLRVSSPPGNGTLLRGEIPCE